MDDYTWQRRLRARRTQERRRLSLVFLLAAALIGAVVWYFFFFIRTPEYALEQIQTALAERDGEKFNQYSDYIRNHTQDAYSRFSGQFWDQIYKKVLIYGAAVIIAILSVITVMRNIFAERENS